MIEIIRRMPMQEANKEYIRGEGVQVSYNDWRHLVIRVINGDADTLVVFDQATTNRILEFCFTQELAQRIRVGLANKLSDKFCNDIPF
jgi:hypothetical protein